MELAEYQRMFDLEDRHWWFQGRLAVVLRMMARHAPAAGARWLDMGCGTGMLLGREGGRRVGVGLDFSNEALAFSSRRGLTRLVQADSQVLPFASNSFDLLTAFDLIEHVPDDAKLVAEAWRALRPGGIMIASVPAHPFLWSSHDVALHHYRRYRKPQFEALFAREKWETIRMTYIFASIFIPATIIRTARRIMPGGGNPSADTNLPTGWLNQALIGWHQREAAWIENHDVPFGLSLLTVRRKIG